MEKFLVGGAVRDQLLNYPYTDKDWVVVGSTPNKMIELGYIPVGNDFPVFLHPKTKEEYALARTERKTAPGYKGFTFHASEDVTLEEDLQRRDLTINAIAQDNNGRIIDPYNGQQDLQLKILRHVSAAFSEDPVRVLRIARFSARYYHLGFRIAKNTLDLMKSIVSQGETQHLVAERTWQECYGAFCEKNPEQFLRVMRDCHGEKDIFPHISDKEIEPCITLLASVAQQDNIQGDKNIESARRRFSALCHPLSIEAIELTGKTLSAPNDFITLALLTKKHYKSCIESQYWTTESLAHLFKTTDALRKNERFEELLVSCLAMYSAEKNCPPTTTKIVTIREALLSALAHYKDVNHQALIQQGLKKSALGEAITQKRLSNLRDWLKGYNAQSTSA